MTTSITFNHPWQNGPSELIGYALEHLQKDTDFDQRIAFLLLDVGVETTCKTFLELPDEVTGTSIVFGKRKAAADGNFHDLMAGVKDAAGKRLSEIDLTHIEYYHDIRNKLYHKGNGITVPTEKAKAYAQIAVDLLDRLLAVNLRQYLLSPSERHPKHNELMGQLEGVASEISRELNTFWNNLPVLLDDIEPVVSRPKFARALADWARTLDYRSIDNLRGNNSVAEYDEWVRESLSSMPSMIREFAEKYLPSSGFKLEVECEDINGVGSILHTSYLYDFVLVAVSKAEVRGPSGEILSPGDIAEALRDYASLVVAEQKCPGLKEIRADLDEIEFFRATPPPQSPNYEEEEAELAGWLESRQESLVRIRNINQTISMLIESEA